MINRFIRLGCMVLALGIAISSAGCGGEKAISTEQTTKQAEQVTRDFVEAPGKIKANDIKNITLDFSVVVQGVRVKEGQRVKRGEELITLDIHDISQQINNKESDLRQGRLQLEISKNGLTTKQSDYQYAQELLNRAKEDYEKKLELYQRLEISQAEIEAEQRKVEDQEKIVKDKQMALEDTRLNIEIQKQKLQVLESDIGLLRGKLNKSFMNGNKVVSDVNNGLVQEITRVEGDSIQPNSKLLNLVNMDKLTVEADVSEDFIKNIKVGAEVEIYPLADPAKIYKGKVLKTADMGIEKNGETVILTEISIENIDEFLKPNFSVDVKIFK